MPKGFTLRGHLSPQATGQPEDRWPPLPGSAPGTPVLIEEHPGEPVGVAVKGSCKIAEELLKF